MGVILHQRKGPEKGGVIYITNIKNVNEKDNIESGIIMMRNLLTLGSIFNSSFLILDKILHLFYFFINLIIKVRLYFVKKREMKNEKEIV